MPQAYVHTHIEKPQRHTEPRCEQNVPRNKEKDKEKMSDQTRRQTTPNIGA